MNDKTSQPESSRALLDAANKREIALLDAIRENRVLPFKSFMTEAWDLLEPGRTFIDNWHIDAICEHLTAATLLEIQNLIINIPPRHMKSLLVSVLWQPWTWTWLPATRWMFQSYSAPLSLRDAVKARSVMRSAWYQTRWGDQWSFSGDQNVKSRYENDAHGFRVSSGIGGLATGEGGDFIVWDDPHKVQEIESEKTIRTTAETWTTTMSTRENTIGETVRALIMQRVHSKDTVGHILEKMSAGGRQYEILCLPAEYEDVTKYFDTFGIDITSSIGFSDPRTEHGALLWESRFDRPSTDELKIELGPYAAAGQLQQRPSPSSGGIFKKHWWGFWQYPGDNMPTVQYLDADGEVVNCEIRTLPRKFSQQAQSWDMTFKNTAAGSFVVGQAWGKLQADKFLLDQVRGRWSFVETCDELKKLSRRFPDTSSKYVEDKANGPAVISALKREVSGLIPYTPHGDKEARASAASPQVHSGNVYLPHPRICPWVWQFIERFADFPNGDKDEIDCLSQILDIWKPGRSATWGRRK